MLIMEWVLRGKPIPRRSTWNDRSAERERAWTRARTYFKKDPGLLEQMRAFIFEGMTAEELERKKQEEWEIFRKRYSDPIQKERLWSAIFEGEGPPYLRCREKDS